MDIISKNKAYFDTISSISNQLNECFTKKGWLSICGLVSNGAYYYHLNKLYEFNYTLGDYNQFNIIILKNHAVNYIKSHPDIIINNNKFSINLNNINVNVFIQNCSGLNFENSIISLNNINVLNINNLFEHAQNIVNRLLNSPKLQFNSENIDNLVKFHQETHKKLLYFKMVENINKLMNEQQTQAALSSASTYMTRRPVPIAPKLTRSLSLLLEAANYIDTQDNTEPPAKRK
jgi:hypothetical protein